VKVFVGKDQDIVVKQDRRERVEGDDHLRVWGKKNQQIDGSQSLVIGKDRHEIVGCVYPLSKTPDCQQDYVDSRKELAQAEQSWVDNGSVIKIQHQGGAVDGVEILKSELAPAPTQLGGQNIPDGSWMLRLRIDNASVWARIVAGELKGYSIGGTASVKAQPVVPAWAHEEADEIEEAMNKCHCQQKSAQPMTEEAELREMIEIARQTLAVIQSLDGPSTAGEESISQEEADQLIQMALLRQAQQMTEHARWQNQLQEANELGYRYVPGADRARATGSGFAHEFPLGDGEFMAK